MNEELLYNQIYEKTKECGRTQFVKLLMDKERENKNLKDEIYKSNAVADTNIELAEKYYKEIERLKSLLKCDYEDSQSIMAELTTENKQLKEQLQNISNEFLKYDWKTSNKEQIINQLESLYNSIFKE